MGYIAINDEIIRRSESFAEFSISREYGLYIYLATYIVRGEMKSNKFLKLYENFYLKGMLASRWSQIDMAKHFNKSQQTISRWAKKLEKRGLIRIYKVRINGKLYSVYVLGTINLNTGNELLFCNKKFVIEAGQKVIKSLLTHSKNECPDTQKMSI